MIKPRTRTPEKLTPATALQGWLWAFIDRGELEPRLHQTCERLAIHYLRANPCRSGAVDAAEGCDLAGDFLLYHIRSLNKREIETQKALGRELARYVTATRNPEAHELWEVLSEATRRIGQQGLVRRLDAPVTALNNRQALWTTAGTECDGRSLDIRVFEQRAASIGCFFPARNEGRVISPGSAEKLLLALLKAADGPAPFQILFDEAKRHVVLHMQYAESVDADTGEEDDDPRQCSLADRSWHMLSWVEEEAAARTKRVWLRVADASGEKVLCLYVLPKHFLQRKSTLSQLGEPQRIGEASQRIMAILAEELCVERLNQDAITLAVDSLENAVRELVQRVAVALITKCSENGFDMDFRSGTDDQGSPSTVLYSKSEPTSGSP